MALGTVRTRFNFCILRRQIFGLVSAFLRNDFRVYIYTYVYGLLKTPVVLFAWYSLACHRTGFVQACQETSLRVSKELLPYTGMCDSEKLIGTFIPALSLSQLYLVFLTRHFDVM